MGNVAEQGTTGVVRAGKVLTVVKQPAGSGVGREVLIGKRAAPPGGILGGLIARGHQRVRIRLLEAAAVEGGITLVLQAPVEPVDDPREGKRGIPFRQRDPAVGAVGEKVLIRVKREVLFVEIGFEMQHVAHSHEARIVRSGGKAGVFDEGTRQQVSAEERFLFLPGFVVRFVHGRERSTILFESMGRWWSIGQEWEAAGQEYRPEKTPPLVLTLHHQGQLAKIASQSFEASTELGTKR